MKEAYRWGDYECRPYERTLLHDGEPVEVEPRIFDVLTVLLSASDRVLPREEIIEAVWGPGHFTSDDTLFKAIQEVRQAVGDSGRNQHTVRTFRGHGYRFVAEVDRSTASQAPSAVPPTREVLGDNGEEEKESHRGLGLFVLAATLAFVTIAAAVLLTMDRNSFRAEAGPNETAALEASAEAATTAGRLQEAIGTRRALLELEPDNTSNHLELVQHLVFAGESDEAQRHLATLAADDLPRDAQIEGLLLQSLIAERQARPTRAVEIALEAGSMANGLGALEARTFLRLAEAQLAARETTSGQASAERALEVAQATNSPALAGQAHLVLAVVYRQSGDGEARAAHLALAEPPLADTPLALAKTKRETALDHLYGGDFAEAAREAREAAELAERGLDLTTLATARMTEGDALTDWGHHRDAVGVYQLAGLAIAQTGDTRQQADLSNRLGIVYQRLGDRHLALLHYEAAYSGYRSASRHGGAFAVLYNLIDMALLTCDTPSGRRYLDEAHELAQELPVSDRAAVDHLAARVLLEEGEIDQASVRLESALEAREKLGEIYDAAASHLLFVEIESERNRPREAARRAEAARPLVEIGSMRRFYADLIAVRAHLAAGDLESAELVWENTRPVREQEALLVLEALAEAELAWARGERDLASELAGKALHQAEVAFLPRQRLDVLLLLERMGEGHGLEWLRQEAERLGCRVELANIVALETQS